MAWNSTITFTTGSILTAAQLNAQIGAGGNIDQTPTALVTTAEDIAVATGSKAMKRLGKGSDGQALVISSGAVAWGAVGLDKTVLYTPGYIALYDGNAGNPVAASGTIRVIEGFTLKARNHANSADHILMSSDTNDNANFGDSTGGNDMHFNVKTGKAFYWDVNAANIIYASVNAGPTPASDNTMPLGDGTHRYTALYAVNGTIQTSSGAAKEGIEPLDVDEALRVVLDTEIVRFRYIAPEVADPDAPPVDHRARDGVHVGFIAEHVDPMLTLGLGPEVGVSPQSTASIALAAIQALARRCQALELRLAESA